MNRVIESKWKIFILTLTCIIFITFSCSDNTVDPVEQGPELPPISTFLMDINVFPGISTQTSGISQSLSRDNWGWAGINIIVWNVVITVNAVVPVAAYLESFNHTPVKQDDNSWLWTYSVTVDDDTYTAKLYAGTDANNINWSMCLSKTDDFTDFLWFTGEHDLLYTEGSWTMYKNPDDPVQYIGIVWHRNLQNSTADIKYINIETGSAGNGGYITYGITNDTEFDAFYDVFIAEQDHYIDIEWNRDTNVGRVMDETHFEDALWHCWDETLLDIDCDSL